MSDKPRFTHDCEHCRFLGQWREFDLYHHASENPVIETFIARHGDEGADFISGLPFAPIIPALAVAVERVTALTQRDAEIARLQAELKRCGKERCMGRQVDGVVSWVKKDYHEAEIALLRKDAERSDAISKLAAFGAWCAREFRDTLADVDGGSAQDAMERFGVIVKRTVTEQCGEACVCVEYGEFPHECYTFPAAIAKEVK